MLATRRVAALLLPLGLLASSAEAQPFRERDVPDALKSWIPWVLDEAKDGVCPLVNDKAVCLWPGRLALELSASGGSFALGVQAERELDVPLPGGDKRWPQAVTLDGKAAAVLEREGKPVVRVPAGTHRLLGRFAWERLPDTLNVPEAIGLVDLKVAGNAVAFPRREEGGLLLLRQGASQTEGENLQLRVFRRLVDGIPLWLETRLVFDVSGKAREVAFSGVLPEGARPVAVSGELPARLDQDGRLRVQVRAGSFTVTLLALFEGRPERFALPKATAPWPDQEVWVFAAAERLRQAQVSGAPPIDPSRTDLPQEWRQLPAFLMEGAAALTLAEVRRGEPEAAPDRLSLSRTLWLDESGQAFTVRDAFSGQLGRSTRLDLRAPGELGRAALGGAGQLITKNPQSGEAGLELREAALRLEADSRLPRAASVAAVGWRVEAQSLQAELKLPPGWRLLAALGVDEAKSSWISRWNLFAFFFVLITAFAAGRLFGLRWGVLALVTALLLHGERDAPRLVWLSLLAGVALLRALSPGVLRKLAGAWWALSLLVLVIALPGFLVDQVRSGLYPQTVGDYSARETGAADGRFAAQEEPASAPNAPPPPPQPGPADAAQGDVTLSRSAGVFSYNDSAQREQMQSNRLSLKTRAKAYDQDAQAVIQTGAGVPTWEWSSHQLGWSGPVSPEHRMRLLLVSPGLNLLLALLRVALSLLFALRLAAAVFDGLATRLRAFHGAAWFLAVLLAVALPSIAQAQDEEPASPGEGGLVPGPGLLEELKQRLTRAAACAPNCVSTQRLELNVAGSELRLEAEVHAGAASSWPLPGPTASWVPLGVTLDGQPAESGLVRLADGFLHLRVSAGVHQVRLSGALPPRDSVTLQFGQRPRLARATAPGWQVDGIREDGSAEDSVQLTRRLAVGATAQAGTSGYAPWLEIVRTFDIGVSWTVETTVRRISPPGQPVLVKVPLVKGMLVTDGERQVKDGELLVTLGRDETEASWSATLPAVEGQPVSLQAPQGKPWSEVWIVNCGPVWQCEATGLPPVSRLADGKLAPEFRPWPGETLTLTFRRPQGLTGRTLTIDRVLLALVPGTRLEDATLDLSVRSSRSGPLTLTLPQGAQIQELKVGGQDRPVRPDGNELTLTIDTGEQPVHLTWRTDGGLGLLHRAPPVALSEPAVNVIVSTQLPESRWLLFVGGPSWGPAVLFWGYLVVLVLFALALARLPGTPLRTFDWLLLGLGIAQLPVVPALVVAGWFLALAWRRERTFSRALWHDLVQIGLVVLTLLALLALYAAVHQGLLLNPDMQVAGNGSSDTLLRWQADRVDGALPRPWVFSLPLWVYRVAMLLWSLWLALRLLRWIPWGFECFTSGGAWRRLSRPRPPKPPAPPAPLAPPAPPAAPATSGEPADTSAPGTA